MKILILTFYYQPDLSAGSFRMTAFVEQLSQMLGPEDSIEVITTMPNRYHTYEQEAQAVERKGNVLIRRIQLPPHQNGMVDQSKSFVSFALGTLKIVDREHYDLVLATSGRLFTAFLGALVKRKVGAKLYLDLRDIFADTIKNVLKNPLIKTLHPVLRLVESFTVKSANKVNLVSEGFSEYFREVSSKQVYSFYTNGIDSEFLEQDYTKKEKTEKKIILYAGNIGEGQGLEKIIPSSAKKLEATHEFWVIGDGGTKNKLQNEIENNQLNNVKLLSPIPRDQLVVKYAECDYLFLHLNDYDAFKKVLPSKLFEYAATGKPILAGVGGYARKFVNENIEGAQVFSPCDSEDFIQKLKGLSGNQYPREKFLHSFNRLNIVTQMAKDFLALSEGS
ncbi:MAG: glycosyltransferase WbuB [SAR324 cluster bacterium]|uniref:Glycosyltransferase WbuB n=1 Tax=SAR324 cluster bacterium TaxID=2024889 RepID=A0A2A4SY66_9DELT|nr:MAG: glycosyltransferase WbuB [SAR324 cluster bacterium]